MKKIWGLIALLLLAACGGGSGSSAGSAISVSDMASVPSAALKVTVSSAPDASPSKSSASGIPADNLRIVIRNENLQVNGQAFKLIQDTLPGRPLSPALPVGSGYTVEALGYNTDPGTGLNTVVSYAIATDVTVEAAGISAAALNLVPVTATLMLPSSVLQGARYNVLANYSSAAGRQITPLQANWFLSTPRTTSFAPFVNHTSATVYASSHSYGAPFTGGVPTSLYFQGVFTVKPTLLNTGESAKRWIFNAHEASMPVTAPINVVIVAPEF